MRWSLGCLVLVLCLSLTDASSLLSKTINADGSREFRIAKQIKHNTCLCQCRCVPEKMDLFGNNRPSVVATSRESLEVDDNTAKDPQKLKTSMAQELAAVTTQPITTSAGSTSSEPSTITYKETKSVPETLATTTEPVKDKSEDTIDLTTSEAAEKATSGTSTYSTTLSAKPTSTSKLPVSSSEVANVTVSTMLEKKESSTSVPEVLESIDAAAFIDKEDIRPVIMTTSTAATTTTSAPTTTSEEKITVAHDTTESAVTDATTELIVTESMDAIETTLLEHTTELMEPSTTPSSSTHGEQTTTTVDTTPSAITEDHETTTTERSAVEISSTVATSEVKENHNITNHANENGTSAEATADVASGTSKNASEGTGASGSSTGEPLQSASTASAPITTSSPSTTSTTSTTTFTTTTTTTSSTPTTAPPTISLTSPITTTTVSTTYPTTTTVTTTPPVVTFPATTTTPSTTTTSTITSTAPTTTMQIISSDVTPSTSTTSIITPSEKSSSTPSSTTPPTTSPSEITSEVDTTLFAPFEPSVISDIAEQDEVRGDIVLKKTAPGITTSKESSKNTAEHESVAVTEATTVEETSSSTSSQKPTYPSGSTDTTVITSTDERNISELGETANSEDEPSFKIADRDEKAESEWNMTTPDALIEKVEFIQSRKDLPERWKGLVLRLKKKLEALKAQKEILKSLSASTLSSSTGSIEETSTGQSETTKTSGNGLTTSTVAETTTPDSDEAAVITTVLESFSTSRPESAITSTDGKVKTAATTATEGNRVEDITKEISSTTAISLNIPTGGVLDSSAISVSKGAVRITTSHIVEATTSKSLPPAKKSPSEEEITTERSHPITSSTVEVDQSSFVTSKEEVDVKFNVDVSPETITVISTTISTTTDVGSTEQETTIIYESSTTPSESTTVAANPSTPLSEQEESSVKNVKGVEEQGSSFTWFTSSVSQQSTEIPPGTTTGSVSPSYSTPEDVTITTPNFESSPTTVFSTEVSITTTPSSKDITTPTSVDEPSTESTPDDAEKVGSFVIQNPAAASSSEEADDSQKSSSSPRRQGESTYAPLHTATSDNSIPFTIGEPPQQTNLFSSILKDIIGKAPQVATTTGSSAITADDTSSMQRSDDFEKRIREERIRFEQAKHLREQQQRLEEQQETETDRVLREELKRRSEEMQKRLDEQKATELRRQRLLEEQQQLEEERLRKIAEEKEAREFAELTSTIVPMETTTKQTRYRLRPSQCAAINKFTRVFHITSPSSWIAKNCQFAKRYFPQASCPQIQSLIESCFVFMV